MGINSSNSNSNWGAHKSLLASSKKLPDCVCVCLCDKGHFGKKNVTSQLCLCWSELEAQAGSTSSSTCAKLLLTGKDKKIVANAVEIAVVTVTTEWRWAHPTAVQ